MIPLVLYCPNDITLLAHKIHACIRWEHNLNSIHLLKVVKVLEKGLEQHTKSRRGSRWGFANPGIFPDLGSAKIRGSALCFQFFIFVNLAFLIVFGLWQGF